MSDFEPPDVKKFFGGLFNVTEYVKDHARLMRFLLITAVWLCIGFGAFKIYRHFFPKKQTALVGCVSGGAVTIRGDDKSKKGLIVL